MTPQEVLKQFFGFDKFRTGQREIIDAILSEKDVLAILPTGGGKSICYQIPAILSKTFSIVISPLIALMKDQVDAINQKKKIAAFINSSLEFKDIEKTLSNIETGGIKLLYVSPEKLENINFSERLKNLHPNFIFVDEAHCISEWGHNFRPSYRKLREFIDFVGFKSISAFTATATEDVRNDIIQQLRMIKPNIFVKGFERENLFLKVINTKSKKEKILEIISSSKPPGIIYTATRKNAEEICDYLRINGIDSVFYHAGLTNEIRKIIQDDFQNGRVNFICATNAFGMGIDKNNIRTLIHYNIPPSIENYYQEIGRAGRDGNDSKIFLFYTDNDKSIQDFFINNSFPTREQNEIVYNAVCDYAKIALNNSCSNYIPLSDELISFIESKNINKKLIESSLKILSSSGYLEQVINTNRHYVQILISAEKINSYIRNFHDNEYKDLLLILLREYGGHILHQKKQINLNHISKILNELPQNLITELAELNNSGIISYSKPSKFPTVKLLGERIRSENLNLKHDENSNIIRHYQNKLNAMIDYVFYTECRFKYILDYFGQVNNNYKCGKCDNCTSSSDDYTQIASYLEEHIIELLNELKTKQKKNTLTNILLGKNVHSRYKSLTAYSSCTHFTKQQIEVAYSLLARKGIIKYHDKEITLLSKTENLQSHTSSNEDYENQLQVFNILRQIRKEAATKYNQSPTMICSDEILRNISRLKPTSASELFEIDGFSQRMYNKIGEDFLSALRGIVEQSSIKIIMGEKNLPENINFILELTQKKYSLSDIAALTKLPEAIVSTQIETLLDLFPELEIEHFFEKGELQSILHEIENGNTELKDLRNKLHNKISYAKLRIALAKKRISRNSGRF